jgi:hypothetical protein
MSALCPRQRGENVAPAGLNLGFLTVLHEPGGHLGGYLVTNQWGRPLEFRLSTAVQPNRIQQVLYGRTLEDYLCGDLIGKTLIDKTATPAQLIVTDTAAALDVRLKLEVPVVWFGQDPNAGSGELVVSTSGGKGSLYRHAQFPGDRDVVRAALERLDGTLDWAEPFGRIREAIVEARRMGVTNRN